MLRPGVLALTLIGAGIAGQLTLAAVSASQAPRFGTGQTYNIGDQVPVVSGTDLNGQPITVDYARTKPTVLYFITANGHFVSANEQAFASLVRLTGSEYNFFVVAGKNNEDNLGAYLASARSAWGAANVGVVKALSPDMTRAIRMGGYPRTLVVSPSGKVLLCVEGTYEHEQRRAIEEFFKIVTRALARTSEPQNLRTPEPQNPRTPEPRTKSSPPLSPVRARSRRPIADAAPLSRAGRGSRGRGESRSCLARCHRRTAGTHWSHRARCGRVGGTRSD